MRTCEADFARLRRCASGIGLPDLRLRRMVANFPASRSRIGVLLPTDEVRPPPRSAPRPEEESYVRVPVFPFWSRCGRRHPVFLVTYMGRQRAEVQGP